MNPDFLDEVERQLIEATERGGRRRRRFHLPRFVLRIPTVAGVAVAVTAVSATALAATITLTNNSHPHQRIVKPTPRAEHAVSQARVLARRDYAKQGSPAGGPVPAGFKPQTFTALGEFTWWMMGPAPCKSAPCTSIVRTTNGGRSFVGIHAPRSFNVHQLRFANEEDGYAFGDQLWTTHDAGNTWQRVRLGRVADVEASGPYVFAVVSRGDRSILMRSPVNRNRWTNVDAALKHASAPMWVQGPTVLLPDGNHVLVSNDYGRSFVRPAGQLGPANCTSYTATAAARVIWGVCSPGTGKTEVVRSSNSGTSFQARRNVGVAGYLGAFAASSVTSAVAGYKQLLRTTDSGAHWHKVAGLPKAQQWTYIGFTNETHGVALGRFAPTRHAPKYRLYYTIDGGHSYHYVPIKRY